MAGHDIIVIGASTGGVETLQSLVKSLPAELGASVFIVLHISADSPLLLPSILERASKLPAVSPPDKTRIEPGRIYVAPPDNHMLLEPAWVRIVRGPRENRHRPAVDTLFRSAAWCTDRASSAWCSAVISRMALRDCGESLWRHHRRAGSRGCAGSDHARQRDGACGCGSLRVDG
jgi:chemotaxis response regulator CheB